MAITQISNNVILDGTILPAKLNISSALRTFLGSATSANLATAITDETGSGSLVFATSPTLTTPTIATINGSTSSNGSITVQGTSNATRTTSNVDLQPSGGGVTIGGTTRNASVIFQINSTTLGFLPPVMTSTQRNAISSPASGLVVYSSDLFDLSLYNGTEWGDVLTTHSASFTSDTLRTAVSDETGTGSLVFAELPTIKPSQQTITNIVTRGTEYGSPSVCLFEDFFGITGLGANWNTSGTGGRGSIAQGSVGQRGRNLGITRILTGTTLNDARWTTLFVGQHQDMIGTIWRADFAIPTLSNIQFSVGGGAVGGGVFRYSIGYDTSVSTTDWLLYVNNFTPVVLSGLGIPAPQTGNFASGTRYRMTLSMTSFTTGYLKLQSAPWNTAVWTTLYDGNLSHSSFNNSNWGIVSPFLLVQTLDTSAKALECDWFAVDYPWIQR